MSENGSVPPLGVGRSILPASASCIATATELRSEFLLVYASICNMYACLVSFKCLHTNMSGSRSGPVGQNGARTSRLELDWLQGSLTRLADVSLPGVDGVDGAA